MKEYRAFILTFEGNILAFHHLNCETQEQAMEKAQQLAVDNPVELWDPPIRVARFEPKKMNPPSHPKSGAVLR
jgi:hypothetical protein